MPRYRGVVVGAGYFSRFHLEAWSRIDEVELTAVCDRNMAAASKAAERFGIGRQYGDAIAMLDQEQPDFVDIVTGPESHLELTAAAVDRGVAVICQKPLAPTFQDACRLVDLAESANTQLMVHDNFRFQPWYREIKRLLDEQAIGELHSIHFRCRMGDGWQPDAYLERQPYFRTMPQFLILETGVHFIDTFRFLAGEIDGVYACLRRLNPDIAGEDTGVVFFEFANDTRAVWDANRFNESTATDPRYTFGEALLEGNEGSIRLYDDGRLTRQSLGHREEAHAYPRNDRHFAGDCVYATQVHFIDCLMRSLPFETRGRDYLRTLRIQQAVYESAATRLPVRGLCTEETRHAND